MGLVTAVLLVCLGTAVFVGVVSFVCGLVIVAAIERHARRHKAPF